MKLADEKLCRRQRYPFALVCLLFCASVGVSIIGWATGVAEAAFATGNAEGLPNGVGGQGLVPLLQVILENQTELGLNDQQVVTLSRLYFERSTNSTSDNTVAFIAGILTPKQFQAAVAKLGAAAARSTTRPADANIIDNMVAAAIQKQTKDKTLVEIGIAADVTERLIAWARIFAYFIAIPLGIALIVLSIFGYSKFEDARKLADKADTSLRTIESRLAEVDKNKSRLDQLSATFDQQVREFQTKSAEITQRVNSLDTAVQSISQRLSFGPSSRLPANVQERLAASAAKFLKYFEGLGYHPKTEVVNFNTKPEIENMASYYDDATQTIYVDARWAGDESILFHEYAHLILYSSLPFNALSGPTRWKLSQVPIEFGLANYFTASARNQPLIGEAVAQTLKTGEPSLHNLENREKVTTLTLSDATGVDRLEDAWGGAFWDIRNKLGQATADQMIYDAWRRLTDGDDALIAQSFLRNLLNGARITGGAQTEEAVRAILQDRGIPRSDL
jgi:hypothetical protein